MATNFQTLRNDFTLWNLIKFNKTPVLLSDKFISFLDHLFIEFPFVPRTKSLLQTIALSLEPPLRVSSNILITFRIIDMVAFINGYRYFYEHGESLKMLHRASLFSAVNEIVAISLAQCRVYFRSVFH